MNFVDLDGVLADTERIIYFTLGLEGLTNPEAFLRGCASNASTFYKYADVIKENLHLIENVDNTRIITSLPHLNKFIRYNIAGYEIEELVKFYSQLKENKIEWVEKNLGKQYVANLLVVNDSGEKQLFCKFPDDEFFDDYKPSCDQWIAKGGLATHIKYKRDYLPAHECSLLGIDPEKIIVGQRPSDRNFK